MATYSLSDFWTVSTGSAVAETDVTLLDGAGLPASAALLADLAAAYRAVVLDAAETADRAALETFVARDDVFAALTAYLAAAAAILDASYDATDFSDTLTLFDQTAPLTDQLADIATLSDIEQRANQDLPTALTELQALADDALDGASAGLFRDTYLAIAGQPRGADDQPQRQVPDRLQVFVADPVTDLEAHIQAPGTTPAQRLIAAGRALDIVAGQPPGGSILDTAAPVIIGTAQADTIVREEAFGGGALLGGPGDDTLTTAQYFDDTVIVGGPGADRIRASFGFATASYATSDAGVTVRLWSADPASGGHAEGDTLSGVGTVIGSEFDDVISGNDRVEVDVVGDSRLTEGADLLIGLAGDDILAGRDLDDILVGGAGADQLFGGAGTDTAAYADSAAGVEVRLWNGAISGGDATGDTLDSIENLMGSAFDDTLSATDADNRLEGLGGDDVLAGRSGDDTLVGGAGADLLVGDAGNDTAEYLDSPAGITVRLWAAMAADGDAEGDTFDSVENLVGSQFADVLSADAADNVVEGHDGNDQLSGREGEDIVRGGHGNDFVEAGDGDDSAVGGPGHDTVRGNAGNDALRGNSQNDIVEGGDGDDRAYGNVGGDIVRGDDGADQLWGLSGNDRLYGGDQGDLLYGGWGGDILNGGPDADRLRGDGGRDIFQLEPDGGVDVFDDFTLTGDDHDLIDIHRILDDIGYDDTDPVDDGLIQIAANNGLTELRLDFSNGDDDSDFRTIAIVRNADPEDLFDDRFFVTDDTYWFGS